MRFPRRQTVHFKNVQFCFKAWQSRLNLLFLLIEQIIRLTKPLSMGDQRRQRCWWHAGEVMAAGLGIRTPTAYRNAEKTGRRTNWPETTRAYSRYRDHSQVMVNASKWTRHLDFLGNTSAIDVQLEMPISDFLLGLPIFHPSISLLLLPKQ